MDVARRRNPHWKIDKTNYPSRLGHLHFMKIMDVCLCDCCYWASFSEEPRSSAWMQQKAKIDTRNRQNKPRREIRRSQIAQNEPGLDLLTIIKGAERTQPPDPLNTKRDERTQPAAPSNTNRGERTQAAGVASSQDAQNEAASKKSPRSYGDRARIGAARGSAEGAPGTDRFSTLRLDLTKRLMISNNTFKDGRFSASAGLGRASPE
jgi:hypothetical protein